MATARSRPLSPHLTIWRWGAHMLVSILHRATGTALATAGVLLFLWWLAAAATGPAAYETFYNVATSWFGLLVGFGLTWVFFQHLGSGIRHLILDTGAAFELRVNKTLAVLTMIFSTIMTLLVWAYILGGAR
jgi:succinate dehydrogenase / fumarate reductase, cytochrome b subunit